MYSKKFIVKVIYFLSIGWEKTSSIIIPNLKYNNWQKIGNKQTFL